MSRRGGFTLLEIMITTALLAVMFALTSVVLIRTMSAWRMQAAYTEVTAGLRDATLAISQELEAAALEDDSSISPPIKGLSVAASGKSISYQVPASLDGKTWSKLIQVRLRSEDTNNNLKLDKKEDADGNGFLDRVVERLEDLNGNGDYTGPGETRILARGIDSLTFAQEKGGRKVQVVVDARVPDTTEAARPLSGRNVFTVVVRN